MPDPTTRECVTRAIAALNSLSISSDDMLTFTRDNQRSDEEVALLFTHGFLKLSETDELSATELHAVLTEIESWRPLLFEYLTKKAQILVAALDGRLVKLAVVAEGFSIP